MVKIISCTSLFYCNASSIFADYHLDSDPTALYGVARGIMAIQSVYGVIPKVYGKGRAARQVADYMQSMRKELQGQEPDIMPQIDSAIILDRKVCFKMSLDGNFFVQSLNANFKILNQTHM